MQKVVAFVTGAGSGLGKATVNHLIKKGALGCYGFDTQKCLNEEKFSNVASMQGDISKEEQVEKALEDCHKKFGKINVIVNCASLAVAFRIFNFNNNTPHSLVEFKKLMEVNVIGTFNVCRLALKYIGKNEIEDEERGLLINTSSVSASEGQTGQVAFSAASAAINGMTLPLARDLWTQNIRCVTIQPGFFDTPLTNHLPENVIEYLANCVLTPTRLGKPEEYANMVEHIISNKYINGTIIRLDGGLRMPP